MTAATAKTFAEFVRTTTQGHGARVCLHRRSAHGGAPVTYAQLGRDVATLAQALLALGVGRGDRVGLIAENRYEWLLADLALASVGAIDVPRGSDTAPGELLQILAHAGCRFAFVDHDKIAQELESMRGRLPELERIFVLAETTQHPGALALGALLELGAKADPGALRARQQAIEPDDLLTIVYTSGTTSEPKGVMLSHANILSNLAMVREVLHFAADDVFLSVLPAWHMYERIMDYAALSAGASLFYTDRRRLKDDLAAVRPTAFAAVPRIWEMLHDGIVNHVHKQRGMRRSLLEYTLRVCRAVGGGRAGPCTRIAHALLGRTVLPKIRTATGGRLRIAVSGGGSLPAHVDETLLGLGIPLLNGYGLTETSPVASVRLAESNRAGTIGPPLPETEIEVRDEHGVRVPRGKCGLLWIRGPQVMRGYYKNAERTAAVLDADGWFNSGDLGCIDADGQIRITGRAKDTIVLASGENVEPEPLEIALKGSPFVDQAVIVGQDQKQLGALLVPIFDTLQQQIPRAQWQPEGGVLRGRDVLAFYRQLLDATLTRARGFRPVDRVASFAVLAEPMTIDNGLLTPTMKVKRHIVAERYAGLIRDLFAER